MTGAVSNLAERFTWLDPFGVLFIVVGTILLGIQEQRRSKTEEAKEGKHKLGAAAFLFPFIYTLFDAASMVFEEELSREIENCRVAVVIDGFNEKSDR